VQQVGRSWVIIILVIFVVEEKQSEQTLDHIFSSNTKVVMRFKSCIKISYKQYFCFATEKIKLGKYRKNHFN